MNDTTLAELKITVERAVRPVQATMARKRRMREELLAHLTGIFEEEFHKSSDELAAVERAKRRFGNPNDLFAELQRTVSGWERICRWLEPPQYQPGESVLHFFGKNLLVGLAVYFATILLLLPIELVTERSPGFGFMARTMVVQIFWGLGPFVAIELLAVRVCRVRREGNPGQLLWFVVLSSVLILGSLPAFAFASYWILSGDLGASLHHLHFACYFAPAAPILIVSLAWKRAKEMRYENEWADLAIGP